MRVFAWRRRALALVAFTAACGWYHGERGETTERTRGESDAEEMRAGIRAGAAEDVAIGRSVSEARFIRNIVGFQGPESVKYDAEQDVWFVTNMTGAGSAKDGNGYISRISAAHPESAIVFVEGGKHGAQLDAPKGTAIHGDTLWVADISVLRAFDRHSGVPLANIDIGPLGAVQLNDVAVGPDGSIWVTDTGIMMAPKGVLHLGPDRVFTIGPGRRIAVAAQGPQISWPNGISWDAPGKRWIVVSFDPFNGRVYSLAVNGGAVQTIHESRGRLDGVEVLRNGAIIYTGWADSSVHLFENGVDRQLIREVPEAADIGFDTRRNQLAIPLSVLGRVQIWSLSGIAHDSR